MAELQKKQWYWGRGTRPIGTYLEVAPAKSLSSRGGCGKTGWVEQEANVVVRTRESVRNERVQVKRREYRREEA